MSDRQGLRRGLSGVVAVLMALGAWGLARPHAASAGWPLDSGDGAVVLGFGASYAAADGAAQHRGVDLAAAAGARVLAPLAGHVTFAGRIPGVGGGRVLAVTIETARGKLTLLPLASAGVAAGAELAEGGLVGTLASDGDGSSLGTHLHVGAREGDLYINPLVILTPAAAPTDEAEGNGVEVGAGAGVTAGGGVVAGGGTAGVSAGGHVTANGGMPAGVTLAPRVSAARPPSGRRARASGSAASAAGASAAYARRGVVGVAGSDAAGAQAVPLVVGPGGVFMPAASQAVGRSSGGDAGVVAWLFSAAKAYAARAVRISALVLLGVLACVGTLWPLWRRGDRKDASQLRVRGVVDDVAAAPSR